VYPFAPQDNRDSLHAERTFIRIVSANAGTVFTYSPATPAAAPSSLEAGQSAGFWASSPFVVHSQDEAHPFFVVAYMDSSWDFDQEDHDNDPNAIVYGAEAMFFVPPTRRYGKRFDFFLPTNYPNAQLVVVRTKGSADVSLDCAGAIVGWQTLDSSYEFARVWISRDTGGKFTPNGACDNGVRSMSSPNPFSVTAFGWITWPFSDFASGLTGSSYSYAPTAAHATMSRGDGGPN
jgi:hypothetical protein